MDELRRLLKKYPHQSFLMALALIWILIWSLLLKILALPLKLENFFLEKQIRHLRLLKQLPDNWQKQSRATDITDLLAILTTQWTSFFPDKKDVSFNQVGQNQLKIAIQNIDEQACMQWLWAMQTQYAFKIVNLKMSKAKSIGMVSVQMVLQVI